MNINPNGQAGNSDPLLEKGLPSNVEAERSILGAILLDNAVCNQAIELMRRDDFFLDSHRHIFDKMVALTERGIPIDLVTLENELRNVNEFEQIGGATFIASLIGGVPRTDTIEHYAKIVKRKALLRGALARSSHLASRITDGGDDEELISFVSEQVSAFNETIRESVGNLTEQSGRRKLITVDELEALPPVEWLIENEIPSGGLIVTYGPSGAGKSFVALDYAARIAQLTSVVYIAAEGASGYASRTRAWRVFNKQTAGGLHFWLDAVQMLDAREVIDFVREISWLQPSLVIIDTLARCMIGGDENSARDMGLFVEACSRVQKTGAAVMVIHHTGKNSATGPRGSSALFGAADTIIELSNDDGLIQLRCEKSKDAKPFEDRYIV